MNECVELIQNLNQGEKKSISHFLNSEKKRQLFSVYQIICDGGSIKDVSLALDKSKQQSSLLLFQLKENILNRLTHVRKHSPVEIELRNSINEIEFLKDRFLYDQAVKRIKAIKPRFLKHERFNYLQEVLLIEVEIDSFLLSEQEFKIRLESIILEYNDYQSKNEVFYRYKVRFYRDLAGIHEDLNHMPRIESFDMNPDENRSGYYFYLRSSLIQNLTNHEFKEAQINASALIKLMENTPHEFDKIPFQRIDVYFMSAFSSLVSGNMVGFENTRSKLIGTPISSAKLNIKLLERLLYLDWVGLSVQRVSTDDITVFLNRFTEIRRKISTEYELRILEQISNYYLIHDKIRQAKKWNNEIINKPTKKQRSTFLFRANIRAIYIARLNMDIDFMLTLIDRTLTPKNLKTIKQPKLLKLLKDLKSNPDRNVNALRIHFFILRPEDVANTSNRCTTLYFENE